MAAFQLDASEINPAATFSNLRAEEPRDLLDKLVARKLSSLRDDFNVAAFGFPGRGGNGAGVPEGRPFPPAGSVGQGGRPGPLSAGAHRAKGPVRRLPPRTAAGVGRADEVAERLPLGRHGAVQGRLVGEPGRQTDRP